MALTDDPRCPHCSASPSASEIADGWCDTCGKQLPSWISAKSGRRTSEVTSNEAMPSRPRFLLWATGAGMLCGLVAAAAALAGVV